MTASSSDELEKLFVIYNNASTLDSIGYGIQSTKTDNSASRGSESVRVGSIEATNLSKICPSFKW